MINDRTSKIENDVQKERAPKISHLIRLFTFGFSSTKIISCVYLSAFIILSLLRPLLAFMWGRYIQTAEGIIPLEHDIIAAILLLVSYFAINFLADLISRYVYLFDDIEQLNIVQANRQQELLCSKMYEKLSSLSPEVYEIPKINDRVDMVFNFVGTRVGGMNTAVMLQSYAMIAKIISVASITASLYLFNPWLCFIMLLAPLPTIWSRTIGQKLRFKFMKDNNKLLRKAGYFQNLMLSTTSKELKTLSLYDFFYNKWKEAVDEYTLKEKELIRLQAIFLMTHNFIINFTIVAGSVLAVVLMALGELSLGALGATLSLVSTLVNDTKELLTGFATFVMKKNEAAQFYDLMELPEQKDEGIDCKALSTIEAKNIKYRYPLTDRYVLDDINLTIRKGEKIAFVGENGMGKTTFVKLITGTLSPSGGELLVNGNAVENVNPISRYNEISAVVQDPSRYVSFTVADNVFLGDTNNVRDENKIDAALSFSGLDNFGKDMLLGKDIGGTELSSGQWQKLAIARAIYRGRDFIILDEPTSNLDPFAETDIYKKYITLAANKTVIFVTHHISIASLADRIIVFSNGKVTQDGTHDELINCEGEYARLYNEQAKWYNR